MVIELERDNDICIIRISGRLATGMDDEYLAAKSREVKGMGCPNILVDIHELHSVGSSGIGFIVDLHTSALKAGTGRLVLTTPSPYVKEVLDLTGLSKIIPVAADVAAARVFLSRGSRSAVGGL
jgi:anti-anti-sigma factor